MAFDTRALYVLTYEGLFRSQDGGVSWALSRQPPGADLRRMRARCTPSRAIVLPDRGLGANLDVQQCPRGVFHPHRRDPADVPGGPPRLLASSDRGLLVSGDSGVTWTPLGGELGTTANIQGLAADAASGLIVAGNDRRMFRSPDFGRSWAPANAGLQSTWIRALALDPSQPVESMGGRSVLRRWTGPGLFHSSDSGFSWSPAGAGGPPTVNAHRHRPLELLQDLCRRRAPVYPVGGWRRDLDLVETPAVPDVRSGDRPGIARTGLGRGPRKAWCAARTAA